ncbi:hypothetical protein Tco_0301612, partial [Tanacetum coccineum]
MSLAYYNDIRRNGFECRGENFVGIGRDVHVFIGNMSHVMDFTILESVEANIDPSLSMDFTILESVEANIDLSLSQ